MKRTFGCLLILLAVCFSCGGTDAQSAERTSEYVAAEIRQSLASHPIPGVRRGIVVRRLSDGKEIFSLRGTELYQIASNTKLFATAAALWALGPNYEFRTSLIANGEVEDGKLNGDLVVVGGGDPNLSGRLHGGDVMTVPREMAAAVKRAGIQMITGGLVMDDRLFDRVSRAPGWPQGESLWWYCAPVSALSFNDNCVDVTVKGAKAAGRAAKVSVSPDLPHVRVISRCKTCEKKQSQRVSFKRNAEGAIVVGGCIRAAFTRSESITVEDPPLFLAAALRAELTALDIRVLGKDRLVYDGERARAEAREILVWRTRLTDAVATANRRSQNFLAEQILKTRGAARGGIGTFETGAEAVSEFLTAAGFPLDAVHLVDGSGLSPGNRATPQAIAALLDTMYRSELKDAFCGSLAVNGEQETTLRSHMTNPDIRGRIRAKTGTIKGRGIRALSGYAEAVAGEVYAFSILSNGFQSKRLGTVLDAEEAVCRALAGVPPKVPEGKGNGGEK